MAFCLSLYKNVSEILLPSLWFEDEIILNKDTKNKLLKLNQIVQLVYTFSLVLVIVGSILTFFSVCIIFFTFIYFYIKFCFISNVRQRSSGRFCAFEADFVLNRPTRIIPGVIQSLQYRIPQESAKLWLQKNAKRITD